MPDQQSELSLQRITLTMVLLNAFTTPLMLSSVNVALPSIATDLSMNAVSLSWIPMAYLMASAMFVLTFGRIADMVGRKRIFLIGTSSVIVTSLIAAFAVSGTMLITARFLQGMSAAMMYATQVAIVASVFPPAKRGRAIGLTVSTIYLGLTIGPLIGGYVIDNFGWRASFMVHIPLAVIVLVMGLFFVKGEWSADERGSFDLFGALLYIFSILLICISVSYLPSTLSLILLTASLLGFFFFFLFERVHKHPMFDVTLFFTNRVFLFSCLASLIIYTATFANVVQVSLYLQYLKGMSAVSAGMVMMCQPLTMAIFSPIAGRLSDKIEPRYLASAGMLVSCIGLLLLSELQIESDLNYLIAALVTTGFGFSLFSSPNVSAIMGSIEKRAYGSANGVVATMRIFGQMTSMVLVTLIFALTIGPVEIEPANYDELAKAIRLTFTIAAILCLPGLYFSVARGKLRVTST
ncbi:MAG TPA: MFS transporter [Thiotrichaceae bacterium]|jgi:EmrB/QacA subfamily drug resistance transporter|nr:MFS transporter [Thiotrichaceae bacterium]HIM08254.1 MFS transporter [Gammaproteobacteria bacterium]